MIVEMDRKMRERERRKRVTRSHSCKIRRPSETVKSLEGPEFRDGRRGTGPARAQEDRRNARRPKRVIDVIWKTGETRGRKEKKRRRERVGSVDVDPGYLDNREKEERGAQ